MEQSLLTDGSAATEMWRLFVTAANTAYPDPYRRDGEGEK